MIGLPIIVAIAATLLVAGSFSALADDTEKTARIVSNIKQPGYELMRNIYSVDGEIDLFSSSKKDVPPGVHLIRLAGDCNVHGPAGSGGCPMPGIKFEVKAGYTYYIVSHRQIRMFNSADVEVARLSPKGEEPSTIQGIMPTSLFVVTKELAPIE